MSMFVYLESSFKVNKTNLTSSNAPCGNPGLQSEIKYTAKRKYING